jgi:hypothetical protein
MNYWFCNVWAHPKQYDKLSPVTNCVMIHATNPVLEPHFEFNCPPPTRRSDYTKDLNRVVWALLLYSQELRSNLDRVTCCHGRGFS